MSEKLISQHRARAAYRAWDNKELLEAAELFFQAAELAWHESDCRSRWGTPDPSFSYRIRGALCLFAAGERDRAAQILQEATTFDWKAARLWSDRHITEQAYTCLIQWTALNRDLKRYHALWDEAFKHCSELEIDFPANARAQEELLDLCMILNDKQHCAIVVRKIRQREPEISKELSLKLHRADRLLYS